MTWTRQTFAAALPVAAVAVIAGIVSFGHIEALALSVHQPLADARLLPLAVDGLIVAGTVVILAGYWLGWLGVVAGVAATVFANVESGLPWGPLAATVAAWPAVAFTVASFVLERLIKRQVGRGTGGSGVAGNGAESTPISDVNDDISDRAEPPLTTREPRITTLEPPEPEVATCDHLPMFGSSEEKVVCLYLHGRDCLGEAPSQRYLAATFGVSRPKVAQLVGPLNGQHPDN